MFFIHYLLFGEKDTGLNLQVNVNEDSVSMSSLPDFRHGPCMAKTESQSVPYPGWENDFGGPDPFQRTGNLISSVNRMGNPHYLLLYFFVCHGQCNAKTIVQSEFGHVKFQKVRVTVWFLLCSLSCHLSLMPRRRSP